MLGIDEVGVDDSSLQNNYRSKKFLNFKSTSRGMDRTEWFQQKDKLVPNEPLFLIYIGMRADGIHYKRMVFGWLDLASSVGGLLSGLYHFFRIFVSFTGIVKFRTKLIRLILSR